MGEVVALAQPDAEHPVGGLDDEREPVAPQLQQHVSGFPEAVGLREGGHHRARRLVRHRQVPPRHEQGGGRGVEPHEVAEVRAGGQAAEER